MTNEELIKEARDAATANVITPGMVSRLASALETATRPVEGEAGELIDRVRDPEFFFDDWHRKLADALERSERERKRRAQELSTAIVHRATAEDAANGWKGRAEKAEAAERVMKQVAKDIETDRDTNKADLEKCLRMIGRVKEFFAYYAHTAQFTDIKPALTDLAERLAQDIETLTAGVTFVRAPDPTQIALEREIDQHKVTRLEWEERGHQLAATKRSLEATVAQRDALKARVQWLEEQMHGAIPEYEVVSALVQEQKEVARLQGQVARMKDAVRRGLPDGVVPASHDCAPLDPDECWICASIIALAEAPAAPVVETQASINAWQVATFGVAPSVMRTVTRMNEEVAELLRKVCGFELIEAAAPGSEAALRAMQEAVEELADVQICVFSVARRIGIDLQDAVDAKMKVNRARKWGRGWDTAGRGGSYHVKERDTNPAAEDIREAVSEHLGDLAHDSARDQSAASGGESPTPGGSGGGDAP